MPKSLKFLPHLFLSLSETNLPGQQLSRSKKAMDTASEENLQSHPLYSNTSLVYKRPCSSFAFLQRRQPPHFLTALPLATSSTAPTAANGHISKPRCLFTWQHFFLINRTPFLSSPLNFNSDGYGMNLVPCLLDYSSVKDNVCVQQDGHMGQECQCLLFCSLAASSSHPVS